MAKKATYIVQYRRKRNGKTDYKKRLNLLKSKRHRLVVRKSNRYIIAQIVDYKKNTDVVKVSATSNELKKFGWTANTSNIPAAYLTGFLCGLRAKSKKIKNAILDTGLNPSVKGSRLYSTLKGAVDSGLEIPHDSSILPDESRITGKHIAEYRGKKNILDEFEKTKNKILNSQNG